MMYENLVRKELRQNIWFPIIGVLLFLATSMAIAGLYGPTKHFIQEIPSDIWSRIFFGRELVNIFTDYSAYVWSQWFGKNLFETEVIFLLLLAAVQFAGEAGKKTMGYLLTRPVLRSQVFLAKTVSGILMMLATVIFGSLSIWVSSLCFHQRADWSGFLANSIIAVVWLSVFYLLGCCISVLFRETLPAVIAIGVTGLALSFPGWLGAWRRWSIFYQMQGVDYHFYGASPWPGLALGLILSAALFLLGRRLFNRRDY